MQNNAHFKRAFSTWAFFKKSFSVGFVLLFISFHADAQTPLINANISGTVLDAQTKEPLPRAVVQLEGVTHNVLTDDNGKFKFVTGQKLPAVLIVSYIGYSKQRVTVNNSPVEILLQPDVRQMNDVVITGYSSQSRQIYTGSASQIKSTVLDNRPAQSFDQLLSGQSAGLNIVQPSGALNSTPVFRIRGINSITSSVYPLFIVDGVTVFTGSGGDAIGNNPLSDINPADIETIDVLKDASATAIYGSRAANGVVIITTKKGKRGAVKVEYGGWASFNSPYNLPKLLNAEQYVAIKNEARVNAGLSPGFVLGKNADGSNVETNWYDVAYHTAVSQNHNLSISGATELTNYFLGLNYTDQNGIIRTNSFQRKGIRLNLEHHINKFIIVGTNAAYNNSLNSGPNSGATGPNSITSSSGNSVNTQYIGLQPLGRLTYILPPNVNVYNPDGSYNINTANGNIGYGPNSSALGVFNAYNLQTILDLDKNTSESNTFIGSVFGEISLLDNLKFKTLYGLNNLNVENLSFRSPLSGDGFSTNGSAANNITKYVRSNWTNTLTWATSILENHNFKVLLGHEIINTKINGWGATRTGLSDPFFTSYQGGFTNIVPSGNIQTENAILSYFSNFNYDYKRRYLLSLNYRRDGLSALASGNKWGNFGGGSVGWNVSEEAFYKQLSLAKTVNALKLRLSYGVVGNSSLDDFASLTQYGSGTYAGTPTLNFTQAGNSALQWESSKKLDYGLEFSLFDSRINITADYYKNDIDGLILSAPQSASQGIPGNSIIANVGSLYNKGFEFGINAHVLSTEGFKWTADFNISTLQNKVTSLGQGGDIYPSSLSTFGIQNVTRVGYSVGSIFAVPADGVNPSNGNKIYINKNNERVQYNAVNKSFSYLDGSSAPIIDNYADGRIQGPSLPTYYGGLNNYFSYKGFDFTLGITFSGGNKLYNGTRSTISDQRYFNNGTFILDRWTSPGQVTDIPKLVWGDSFTGGFSSSNSSNVEKGDYVKLKNISIGYRLTLPKEGIGQYISSARIYGQASNLWTITSYTGSDPEISINGNSINSGKDQNVPVNARAFTIGLNLSF
ncbi:SusC/RagA family TonB-linked outer membrane protein [Pedobacter sp. MC2016-14]|uniref:SusC/RagA family TonB-linked outer membrane protein n=1 Tax=Pedobacter sp. MC2016-14 TaxID=2897327 RepID=UPI001E3F17A5|nr:SusC/RagA family TonB-linked outer membrane protein [Pedobacter sp. MC2016-14]MCD0489122.1 SusC/RagA family TonB-linked outer membrane protein [Pedobacter sp. MC2016-14]